MSNLYSQTSLNGKLFLDKETLAYYGAFASLVSVEDSLTPLGNSTVQIIYEEEDGSTTFFYGGSPCGG